MATILITVNPDGEVSIKKYSKETLLDFLELGDYEMIDTLDESNPMYWGSGDKNAIMFIDGKVTTPMIRLETLAKDLTSKRSKKNAQG